MNDTYLHNIYTNVVHTKYTHGLQTVLCIVQNIYLGDSFKCCIQTYLLSTLTQSSLCLVLVEEVGTFGAEDRGLDSGHGCGIFISIHLHFNRQFLLHFLYMV